MVQTILPAITVNNYGVPGENSAQIAARMVAATSHYGDMHVFMIGVNDGWNQTAIMNGLASMVGVLDHDGYLVLMPPTGSLGYAPPAPPHMADLKAAMEGAYPDNFFDMRTYQMGYANPQIPQDAIDVANDTVPGSLRIDGIHPTQFACHLMAEAVYNWFAAKQWIY